MSVGPVEKVSLSDAVTDHLRQAIYEGTFEPGRRIVVDQVAKMLQTSSGPVRDALSRLEHEGLIVRERNQGAVVVDLSLQDIHEICSLRLALETTALAWTVKAAEESELAELERILAQLSINIETRGAIADTVKLDLEFHERLVRLSGHRRLLATWKSLRSQLWFLICSYKVYRGSGYRAPSHASHFELVQRLRERDLDGAQRCLQQHLDASAADFVTAYNARTQG
jgi:DNA-binding GntR family transcriptional regulator